MNAVDVVVVGAGPAGAALAALLASSGIDAVALDRAAFPRPKTCAEYSSPGVEDALRDIGCWERVQSLKPRFLMGMVVRSTGGAALPVSYNHDGRQRHAFTLPRIDLDLALVLHARVSGAAVEEGWQVIGVERDTELRAPTIVRARRRDGETRDWRCRIVVGADGMHSCVARSLGIRARHYWPRRLGLIAHYAEANDASNWGEMHVGHGVYCGLAPLPDQRVNVGLVVDMGRRNQTGTEATFREALDRLPAVRRRLQEAQRVSRLRGMGPMTRRVARVAGPGFLLVGDAAGFFDPFTGEGIHRALRGAQLAAGCIQAALATTRGVRLPDLSPYAYARRRSFAAKELVTWLVQLAMISPPAFDRICRHIVDHPAESQLLANILGDLVPARTLLGPRHLYRLLAAWRFPCIWRTRLSSTQLRDIFSRWRQTSSAGRRFCRTTAACADWPTTPVEASLPWPRGAGLFLWRGGLARRSIVSRCAFAFTTARG